MVLPRAAQAASCETSSLCLPVFLFNECAEIFVQLAATLAVWVGTVAVFKLGVPIGSFDREAPTERTDLSLESKPLVTVLALIRVGRRCATACSNAVEESHWQSFSGCELPLHT